MTGELHISAPFDAGADNYVIKKSESFRVLLARIQAHLRRDERMLGTKPLTTHWVGTNHIRVDKQDRQLAVGNSFVALTVQQTKIMAALTANPSKIFSTDELLTIAWDRMSAGPRPLSTPSSTACGRSSKRRTFKTL